MTRRARWQTDRGRRGKKFSCPKKCHFSAWHMKRVCEHNLTHRETFVKVEKVNAFWLYSLKLKFFASLFASYIYLKQSVTFYQLEVLSLCQCDERLFTFTLPWSPPLQREERNWMIIRGEEGRHFLADFPVMTAGRPSLLCNQMERTCCDFPSHYPVNSKNTRHSVSDLRILTTSC